VEKRSALAAAGISTFVAPSFPVLESAVRILDGSGVLVAAQNAADSLAVSTGEVEPRLLAELGVTIVELGHYERRSRFGETDAVVAAKVSAARAAGLTPLLCVGEWDRMSASSAADWCAAQIRAVLGDGVAPEGIGAGGFGAGGSSGVGLGGLVVAYEPAWAIGAAEPASPDYVNEVLAGVRNLLGDSLVVIYGGSAGPGLLPQLSEADGLFLGRFAHDASRFGAVLDEALELRS
jgi:triosephosphate isomerase